MPEGLDYMRLIIFCLLESRICPYLRLECIITALLNQNQIYSSNSVFHVDFFVSQPSKYGEKHRHLQIYLASKVRRHLLIFGV